MDMSDVDLTCRLHRLGALLRDSAELWRPAPFHHDVMPWIETHPELHEALLSMPHGQVETLHQREEALREWLELYIPGMAALNDLIDLPALAWTIDESRFQGGSERGATAHAPDRDVPGRKWAQIEAFASLTRPLQGDAFEILDWCAGKAHLGRLIGLHSGLPVRALERDASLCADAERLAARDGIALTAKVCDVLNMPHRNVLSTGTLACALHACGDLHLAFLDQARRTPPTGLLLAPCCYHRTAHDVYRPRSAAGRACALQLTREDLRLAVLETVTAGHGQRETEKRRKARLLALKTWGAGHGLNIGDYALLKDLGRGDDAPALTHACHRLGWPAPAMAQIPSILRSGWKRVDEIRALELIRAAIRRPLEVWLVLDMALGLEVEGYEVEVGPFCVKELTPRNLMIRAARRA